MAIKMETCFSDQTATVKKLLDQDFEPFVVFPVKAKKNDQYVTRMKMYFRKSDLQAELPQLETLEPSFKLDIAPFAEMMTDALSAFFDQIKRSDERLIDTLGELITEVRELKKTSQLPDLSELIKNAVFRRMMNEPVPADVGEDFDFRPKKVEPLADDEVERREISGATRVDIEDERHPVREGSLISGDGPEGDSFRVIDDVPPEAVASRTRTEAQDHALNKIRQINEGTNLSIFTPNEQGYVRVLVGSWIYMIAPDGTYSEEETKANTNSLVL